MSYPSIGSVSPSPEDTDLAKKILKDRQVREVVVQMIEALVVSYNNGHQSFDKQHAYIRLNTLLKALDLTAVGVYNRLRYGKR